ncbi:MAG TPA: hypothetical protein VM285_10520, partial [Polyangia bacterium]|nr:hypothetical protein [Polyangia bacterium]
RVLTMLNLRDADPAIRPFAWLVAAATAGKPDVIVSQPGPRPGVLCLGRPGTRLPYVVHFGLHYQIHGESIILIFMPGTGSSLRPADLAASLERDLLCLLEIAGRAGSPEP